MDIAKANQIDCYIANSSLLANIEPNCELKLDDENHHSTIHADPELRKDILDFLAAL